MPLGSLVEQLAREKSELREPWAPGIVSHLIDIRIVFEHFTVRGLDENCNPQIGPPGLQRRIERS